MGENNKINLEDVDFGRLLFSLLDNENITDITNREKEIWVTDFTKGHYKLNLDDYPKEYVEEMYSKLALIPRQLAIRMVKSFNEGDPMLDAESVYKGISQLRINAIHESLTANKGIPSIAFRNTPYKARINENTILESEYANRETLDLLMCLIASECNVMIAGETGSGKTSLLRFLAKFIQDDEAIITMEDTLEVRLKLHYPQKDVLELKTTEEFGYQEMLRACLRQNPDWIVVSETRGEEVNELMEAVGTGHRLISTLHADSAANIPNRMVDMSKQIGEAGSRVYRQVHRNLDIGIYIHYFNDEYGSHRKLTEVCEYYVDTDGKCHQHSLVNYNYKTKKWDTNKILSERIKMKLYRSRQDYSAIKDVFL